MISSEGSCLLLSCVVNGWDATLTVVDIQGYHSVNINTGGMLDIFLTKIANTESPS